MKKIDGLGLSILAAATLASAAHAAAPAGPHYSLGFLKFTVADLPKMQNFYQTAFGLTQQKRLDNGANIEVILTNSAGLDLALVYYKDNRKVALGTANGPIGFYLKAAEVDAAYASAIAAGAKAAGPVRSIPGGRVAMLTDPEGHEIELLHLD